MGVPGIGDASAYDNHLGAEGLLPTGDTQQPSRVVRRKWDSDGNLLGTSNANPILDTRTCEVEFPDGDECEQSARIIALNMCAMCDVNGNQVRVMECTADHRKEREMMCRSEAEDLMTQSAKLVQVSTHVLSGKMALHLGKDWLT